MNPLSFALLALFSLNCAYLVKSQSSSKTVSLNWNGVDETALCREINPDEGQAVFSDQYDCQVQCVDGNYNKYSRQYPSGVPCGEPIPTLNGTKSPGVCINGECTLNDYVADETCKGRSPNFNYNTRHSECQANCSVVNVNGVMAYNVYNVRDGILCTNQNNVMGHCRKGRCI